MYKIYIYLYNLTNFYSIGINTFKVMQKKQAKTKKGKLALKIDVA